MPAIMWTKDADTGDPCWLLYWDTSDLYLEVELFGNGDVDWFWRQRSTGAFGGCGEKRERLDAPGVQRLLRLAASPSATWATP